LDIVVLALAPFLTRFFFTECEDGSGSKREILERQASPDGRCAQQMWKSEPGSSATMFRFEFPHIMSHDCVVLQKLVFFILLCATCVSHVLRARSFSTWISLFLPTLHMTMGKKSVQARRNAWIKRHFCYLCGISSPLGDDA
jgi:hypothetical protein